MLTLVALDRLCGDEGRKRRWYLAAGLIAGIAFLYRHDLGLACLGTAALALVMQVRLASGGLKLWVEIVWTAAGFFFPLACWFLALAVMGGPVSCRWYLSALLAGTSGVVEHWRLPWPRWNWHAPGVRGVVPCSAAGHDGALLRFRDPGWGKRPLRRRPSGDATLLFAAGLLGVALAPQALFRPDLQHILQIIPPLVVVASIFLMRLLCGHGRQDQARWKRALELTAALLYLTLLVFPMVCLRPGLRFDMARPGRSLPALSSHCQRAERRRS